MANDIELVLQSDGSTSHQPVTVGIPLPRGRYQRTDAWRLTDPAGTDIPVQTDPLATWPDGSIRWLLVDFIAGPLSSGTQLWRLTAGAKPSPQLAQFPTIEHDSARSTFSTGAASFRIGNKGSESLLTVDETLAVTLTLTLTDAKGTATNAEIQSVSIECPGPVRATACIRGKIQGGAPCRFVARACFFAGLGLCRMRVTLHNPRRALHRGNLWDLGDPNSIRFHDLTLALRQECTTTPHIRWSAEPGQDTRETSALPFQIFQASSGGENWRSRNHVNSRGEIPNPFRGYRVHAGERHDEGLRANPVVTRTCERNAIVVAVPEFWQQFPKAVEIDETSVLVRLFPRQFGDAFELQGGEQKTHNVWFESSKGSPSPTALEWVHRPVVAGLSPEAYFDSGAFPDMAPSNREDADQFDHYMEESIEGPKSIIAGREVIDEYGWRNFGDIYADHENAYASSPRPIVSHYNNQFDSIYGALLQFARTGDRRWRDLSDPLARHVIDIDIYHTEDDRSAYRGGLFWMTDHYKDAASSTHRTFSRVNQSAGRSYGGGPGCEHNFTSGLLYYHYITGDPQARDAVLSLADWVIRMDDGRLNRLGWIDRSPTGLASMTGSTDYHGPGRGPGLSINALLDGWLLSGDRKYLEFAETLIRRCVHPADDVAAREMLDIERRWSCTIFFTSLARYLRVKAEASDCDGMYAYARASLLHYAEWMADNEIPYFDQRQRMEFPTETWAAQDFRKANVLRLAAAHSAEPARRRFLERATLLADRAWTDLMSFDSRHVARAVAIMMTEGTRDQFFRRYEPGRALKPLGDPDFGIPEQFSPQKLRIKNLVRSPRGWLQILLQLAGLNAKPTS